MPVTYIKAPDNVIFMVGHALTQWHQELYNAKIKIGVLFKFSSSEDTPAIKSNGHPVDGIITIVSSKDRLSKGYDAEITFDGDVWSHNNAEYQYGLIDHLLSRIELKPAKKKKNTSMVHGTDVEKEETAAPAYMVDNAGRPCLKLRIGDWNVGFGYEDVIRRHGENAPEYRNLTAAQNMVTSIMKD